MSLYKPSFSTFNFYTYCIFNTVLCRIKGINRISFSRDKLNVDTSSADVLRIERAVYKVLRKNQLSIDFTIRQTPTMVPYSEIRQGAKLKPNHPHHNTTDAVDKFGTLGIVLQEKNTTNSFIGITAAHVLCKGRAVELIGSDNSLISIGTCIWSTFIGEEERKFQSISDIAVARIQTNNIANPSVQFGTASEEYKCALSKHTEIGDIVYKVGAATGETEGKVKEKTSFKIFKLTDDTEDSNEEYHDCLSELETSNLSESSQSSSSSDDDYYLMEFIVICNKDGQTFAAPGDSGSIVFSVNDIDKKYELISVFQCGVVDSDDHMASSLKHCLERYAKDSGQLADFFD